VKILLKSGQADLESLRPGLSVTASIRTSPR
jgi:hypothetical protein